MGYHSSLRVGERHSFCLFWNEQASVHYWKSSSVTWEKHRGKHSEDTLGVSIKHAMDLLVTYSFLEDKADNEEKTKQNKKLNENIF